MPDLDHAAVKRYAERLLATCEPRMQHGYLASEMDQCGVEVARACLALLAEREAGEIFGERMLRPPEEVRKELATLMAVDKSQVEFMDCAEIGAMLARCELVAHYYCEQLKLAGGVDGKSQAHK